VTICVVTDSTADIPEEIAAEYGVSVIPVYINVEGESYLDGVELSREEFYERLPDYDPPPKTSAPSLGAFLEVYERLAKSGVTDVISIHISSTLSGVLNVAKSAAEATEALRVTVFDSKQLTLGTGFLAIAAAKAAKAGGSLEEIVSMLQRQVARTTSFAALETLEYLKRGGRISQIQASLGALLRIKSLLKMYDGEMAMERIRTTKRLFRRLVDWVDELSPLEQIAIVHANAPERAEELWERIRDVLPAELTPVFAQVTPAIGTHVGPDSLGLVCVKAEL